MNTWIKRSLAVTAVAGGLMLAGATSATADDAQSTSTTESSLSSPIEIGGIGLGIVQDQSSSSSSTSTVTDADGTSTTTESSSTDTDRAAGIAIDPTTIDPAAVLATSQASQTDEGAGNTGTSQQSSSQSGAAQAPIRVGGVNATGQQQETTQDAQASSLTDEDGTRSSSSESNGTRSTGGTLGTGALDVSPGGAVSQSGSSESDEAGDDISSNQQSSSNNVEGNAPFAFEGLKAGVVDQQTSQEQSSTSMSDEDGTRSSEQSSADASTTGGAVELGKVSGNPAGTLTQSSSSSDEQVGDDISGSESTSSTEGALSGPFSFAGAQGVVGRDSTSSDASSSSVSDEDGTRSSSSRDESATSQQVGGATGAFTGSPVLEFLQQSSSDSEQVGDEGHNESASSQRGAYAFPFDYNGFGTFAELVDAQESENSSTVSDEDGTSTSYDTESTHSENRPTFGFDGLAGNPAGVLDSENLTDQD